MAFDTPLTKTENYTFGRGVLFFAPFDSNGRPLGERDLGNTPGFSLSVTSERFEHTSSRTGISKTDLDRLIKVKLGAKVDIEDISAANQALFIAGSTQTITQAASPVTNERIYNLEPGRHYQLGASTQNPSGAKGVGSVTVKVYELVNAAARVNGATHVAGDIFKSSTNVFLVTAGGVLAGSPPTFDTAAIGNATTDGAATVKFLGVTSAYSVGTADSSDYWLSEESARVGIPAAGRIGLAAALYTEVTEGYLSLNADYTPTANSRTQIVSAGTDRTAGQLRFLADNAFGDNRDLFIASCSLSPNGDFALITGTDLGKFSLDVGVNERDTSTPQIIIDGRPVAV